MRFRAWSFRSGLIRNEVIRFSPATEVLRPKESKMIRVTLAQREQNTIFEEEAKCEITWLQEEERNRTTNETCKLTESGHRNSMDEAISGNGKQSVFLRVKKFNDMTVTSKDAY